MRVGFVYSRSRFIRMQSKTYFDEYDGRRFEGIKLGENNEEIY